MANDVFHFRHAAKLLDEGHPAATAHCALAKKIATDQGKLNHDFFKRFLPMMV